MCIYGEFFFLLAQTQVEESKTPPFISDPLKTHTFTCTGEQNTKLTLQLNTKENNFRLHAVCLYSCE